MFRSSNMGEVQESGEHQAVLDGFVWVLLLEAPTWMGFPYSIEACPRRVHIVSSHDCWRVSSFRHTTWERPLSMGTVFRSKRVSCEILSPWHGPTWLPNQHENSQEFEQLPAFASCLKSLGDWLAYCELPEHLCLGHFGTLLPRRGGRVLFLLEGATVGFKVNFENHPLGPPVVPFYLFFTEGTSWYPYSNLSSGGPSPWSGAVWFSRG